MATELSSLSAKASAVLMSQSLSTVSNQSRKSNTMKNHLIITLTLFIASCCLAVPSCNVDPVDPIAVEVVEVTPEVVPTKNAIIEMQLADWCSPCRAFKRSGIIKDLEAKGWTIVYTDDIASKYPSFRVWVNGESSTFSGYSNRASFFRTIKSIIKDLK